MSTPRFKVLLACRVSLYNPLIRQLVDHLLACSVVDSVQHDPENFWDIDLTDVQSAPNVVHFHWPEALYSWAEPDEHMLNRLQARLNEWKTRAVLVATVHDWHPHYRDVPGFRKLFHLLYRNVDAIIHTGHASRDGFNQRYPDLASKHQVLIPEGMNAYFRNDVSKAEARQHLKIAQSAFVVSSVGSLRIYQERAQLEWAWRQLPGWNKRLLIAGGREMELIDHPKRWGREWQRARLKLDPRVRVFAGHIPNDDVQFYVNAADVLALSRLKILNSGNVILGFSFGRVVVGPDLGVVGEILRKTGNPVYTPGDVGSFAAALRQARTLAADGLGAENYAYALQNWNWEHVIGLHLDLYEQMWLSQQNRVRPVSN